MSTFDDRFQTHEARNFPEDYHQENGNYINTCKDCKLNFRGNKHRIWCKMCEEPNWDELAKIQRPDGPNVIPGAWLQGEMVGYSRCMVKRVKPLLSERDELKNDLRIANETISALKSQLSETESENAELKKEVERLKGQVQINRLASLLKK